MSDLEQELKLIREQYDRVQAAFAKQSEISTDLVMRVSALEKVLINKNLIEEREYVAELEEIGKQLSGLIEAAVKDHLSKEVEASQPEPQ
jgi:hypothetical protein